MTAFKTSLKLMAPALLALSSPAFAVPFGAEGYIQAFGAPDPALGAPAGSVTVTCGSVVTIVTPSTVIQTPTRQISIAEMIDPTIIPAEGASMVSGLPRQGFIGGFCVPAGDTATIPGAYVANKLRVDVAVATLVGVVTSGEPLKVNGVTVVDSTDPRVGITKPAAGYYDVNGGHPAGAPSTWPNAFTETKVSNEGFGILANTTPAGGVGSVVGYWGTDNVVHSMATVVDGRLAKTDRRVSVAKGACVVGTAKGRDTLSVSGGCVLGAATSVPVNIQYLPGPTLLDPNPTTWVTAGSSTCSRVVPVVATPATNVGRYKFVNNASSFFGSCPTQIRVTADNVKYDYYTFPR